MSTTTDRDLFLLAAFLPESRRTELIREAGDDPELLARIRASDEFHDLLAGLREGMEGVPGDEALTFLAVARSGSQRNVPSPALEALERFEAGVYADPASAQRYARVRKRLAELDAESDAAGQFERLTGMKSEPARPRLYRIRRTLSVAAVLVFLVAAVALLGRFAESTLSRSVIADVQNELANDVTLRGPDRFDATVRRSIEASRSRLLGIWPRYDRSRLSLLDIELTDMLSETVDPAAESLSTPELLLNVARVRILLDNHDGARAALTELLGAGQDPDRAPLRTEIREAAQDLMSRLPTDE